MIHPGTELRFISNEVGNGVFATTFIPKGTIVYIKDELEIVIPPDDPRRNDPLYKDVIEKYSYTEPNGNFVLSWDIGRYVNHCCNCNIISTGYGFEIAIRDIQAGEEITDEYGLFNSGWEIDLVCTKPGCRKKLQPSDLDLNYEKWDAAIKSAFDYFEKVDQPLLKYMEPEIKDKLNRFLKEGRDYISVLELKIK
ncbi:MAG TPA: SET domain-containing protein [Flavobacteriales bacterium]|nr:SET domain-containing protein [Flavobacteriales bacterium]